MLGNFALHPFPDAFSTGSLVVLCAQRRRISVDNVGPRWHCLSVKGQKSCWRSSSYLGSSVASFALSTPITAASAISGWVKRRPSSSAGGTKGDSNLCNDPNRVEKHTLEALVLNQLLASIHDVVETVGVSCTNVAGLEPPICGDRVFRRRRVVQVALHTNER